MRRTLILVPLLALLTAPALGLEVIVLGTGYPRPHPDHAGPATAVVHNGRWYLVDAGRGVTLRIAAAKLGYENLGAVLLTHLHSDHTAGLPDVFTTSWQFGRGAEPLRLYGPPGVKKAAKAVEQFFAEDIRIRRDLVERHPGSGATIAPTELREGVVLSRDGLTVTAFRVDHAPVRDAFGFRFEAGGKSVVISGDARPSENLRRYAAGADVFVLEAYLPGHFERVDTPEVAERLKRYHTSAVEAGELAAAAKAKTLVLTHLIPPDREEEFRRLAGETFSGTIIVARDLTRVNP